MGNLERESDHLQKAVEYYSNSLEIFSGTDDYIAQADLLNNIGLVCYDIKELNLAYEYLDRARAFYEKADVLSEYGNVSFLLASVLYDKGKSDEALELCRKGIKSFITQNNSLSLGESYHFMGEIFAEQSLMDSAFFYAQRGLEKSRYVGNADRIRRSQILLAELYQDRDPERALNIAGEIESSIPLLTRKKIIVEAYELLYNIAKFNGDAEKALLMNEKFLIYSDSLDIEEVRAGLIRQALKESFEAELGQEQLALKEEKQELKDELKLRTFGVILICLLSIGILIYLMRKKRSAQEKKN